MSLPIKTNVLLKEIIFCFTLTSDMNYVERATTSAKSILCLSIGLLNLFLKLSTGSETDFLLVLKYQNMKNKRIVVMIQI